MRILALPVLALLLAAAAPEPVAPVAALDDALLAAMKDGRSPLPARTAKLLPVVRATHDLPTMAALVVGPGWATTQAADRAALIETFARHSAVGYAANFSKYGGEKFVVDPEVRARGADRVVRTAIVSGTGRTTLDYRLRSFGTGWRIVDIYADGVSQIAVQRSEFAATIKAGGVAALVKRLDALDDARLKRR